jgi:serralysin
MALPVWTNTQIVSNLLRDGSKWSGTTISFGFPQTAPAWSAGQEGTGFSPFTAAQREAARLAISLWDDVIAPDFQETTSNPKITFQNTTTAIGYAHAYFPGLWGGAGSVWTNPQYSSGTSSLTNPTPGGWGFKAYMHEIGHALGLEHPADYAGSASYETNAWYRQDTNMYTVMSYFTADKTGADWVASDGKTYYPQTPMLHDILAIQALYGAEMNTRGTDTVYGFNSTADRDVFDFAENRHPVLCIWDGGGNDTLDFSGFNSRARMDLRPGRFSDCDGMTKNVSIAIGTHIENASGGSAADHITGNAQKNVLLGNAGNDTLEGGSGADTLAGGRGNDRLAGGSGGDRLTGGPGADLFIFRNESDSRDVILDFQDGFDLLRFETGAVQRLADLAITGQGTANLSIEFADSVVVIKSSAAVILDSHDIIFA